MRVFQQSSLHFPTNFITYNRKHSAKLTVSLKQMVVLITVLNGTLTGGGVVEGFIEWLYEITGQRDGGEGVSASDYFWRLWL